MTPDELDRTWGVAGRGLAMMAGPLRAVRHHPRPLRTTVTLLTEDSLSTGTDVRRIQVAESGVRDFEVVWSEGSGNTVVATNPAGGNKVAWSADLSRYWLSPASSAHLSAVFMRFVLRHVTTSLLATDLGALPVHAVCARLSGDGRVIAVVGPTRSGKTRLANRLIAEGVADSVVDDDCPLLTPAGALCGLVPARYEVVRAIERRVGAVVILDPGATEPSSPRAEVASSALFAVPRPWPAPWLPHDGELPPVPLPGDAPVLTLPVRDDEDTDYAEVSGFLRAALGY